MNIRNRRLEKAAFSMRTSMRLLTSAATVFLIAVGFTGCASSKDAHASLAADSPPQPYMRVSRPDSNTVVLQIAARRFVPAKGRGPVVWLTGASHIGESNYFAALQRHLDTQ